MIARKSMRCVIVDPANNAQICTGIQINVPAGLTRTEAVDFVTGKIAGEVSRYAASEALGLGPVDQHSDWKAIVT